MSRELPILFSAAMVLAILAGRKMQTRRVPPQDMSVGEMLAWGRKRYGAPGDVLYVRESWRTAASLDDKSPAAMSELARGAGYSVPWAPLKYEADGRTANADTLMNFGSQWGRCRPSLHMPKWASRIRLPRKSDIRLERLYAITCDDIRAEGFLCTRPGGHEDEEYVCLGECQWLLAGWWDGWDRINGKRPGAGTADDPLVVVVDWKTATIEPSAETGP